MINTASGDFENLLSRFPAPVREVATAARSLIADVLPGVVEVVWAHQGTAGYGTGPKKMSEQFCYLALFDRHVNLGFYYGAELPDPHHLLSGTGQRMRAMRLTSVDDLGKPGVQDLIEAATKHRVPPLRPATGGP
jgi:hypothetical protein